MLLEDLWYGNIQPQNQSTANNPEIHHLLKLLDHHRKRLCTTMTAGQQELFEIFDDCATKIQCISEREAFAYGFRLGGKLTAEALQTPLYQDE